MVTTKKKVDAVDYVSKVNDFLQRTGSGSNWRMFKEEIIFAKVGKEWQGQVSYGGGYIFNGTGMNKKAVERDIAEKFCSLFLTES